MSFTLTVVIVAVVVLVSALTILIMQGDFLNNVYEWVAGETDSGFSRIERQQIRSGCRDQMDAYCDTLATGNCPSDFVDELEESQYWVCNADFEEYQCYEAWEDSPASVPDC